MPAIHEYVYNKSRQPVGVFAATVSEENINQVVIGWSRCNVTAGDRFDKNRGAAIAYERSMKGSVAPVPESMVESYDKFINRSRRYFKNKTVIY
jgi:hypothetical protein